MIVQYVYNKIQILYYNAIINIIKNVLNNGWNIKIIVNLVNKI